MTFDLAACDAIEGWMSAEELRWLHDEAVPHCRVLEVGCWKGRSARALAQGCGGQVFTVDHFNGSPDEPETHADARTTNLYAEALNNALPNCAVLRRSSRQAARMFRTQSLDMVFLDGDHSVAGLLADLLLWAPKATSLLCGHDVDWASVQEALTVYGIPFERGPGSIWFMRLMSDG